MGARLSHPRRHPWNSHHQHNRVIDHLVNEQQLWNPHDHKGPWESASAPQQGYVDEIDELLPTTKGTQREVQFHQQTSNSHATAETTTSAATSSSGMCAGRNENRPRDPEFHLHIENMRNHHAAASKRPRRLTPNMYPLSTQKALNTETIPEVISQKNAESCTSKANTEHRTKDCQIQGDVENQASED